MATVKKGSRRKPATTTATPEKKPCGCQDHAHEAVAPLAFTSDIQFLSNRLYRLERLENDRQEIEIVQEERARARKRSENIFLYGIAAGLWLAVLIVRWQRSRTASIEDSIQDYYSRD